jgi:integrase
MPDMPRPRSPYLSREVTRHGKPVWYVRRNGKRIRLRADFGTPEFNAEYQAACNGIQPQKAEEVAGTLGWLICRYRERDAWQRLSLATRQRRESILQQVLATSGDKPISRITSAAIAAGRDRRKPFQAVHFLQTMRGLFRWAVKAKLVRTDPTTDIEEPVLKIKGFPIWSEEAIAAYEARWLVGTRQRVWLDVLLYTGLRRGDAVRLGRQHVRNGVATLKTEKTDTEVTLPILPVLAETLAAGPCGDLAFIVGAGGQPLTKGAFGNAFRAACRAAGLRGVSAHGLRKVAATRAANAGATVAQLEAIFGWSGGRMASVYTRAADRRRLAAEAMHKLANV